LPYTVRQLAEKIGAEFSGDGDAVIQSAAPIESAGPGQITFLSNPAYKKFLATTKASAVVVGPDVVVEGPAAIVAKNPYLAFSQIIDLIYPPAYADVWEIHPTAVVAESASLPDKVSIGPHAVIEDDAVIGENTVIGAGTFIGTKTRIGSECRIAPNVSIMHECRLGNNIIIHAGTVIGSDGFGFAPSEPGQEFKKIRQVGWVEIGDNVELGANVTVDRGAIGPTVIERGVKVDNLVMIAHNVRIGENSIIVAQVGISGSTKLGKSVILAGQVGLVGHIQIGDGAVVGAQSGVSKSLEGGRTYFGYPARPIGETMKLEAALKQLPELLKRVKAIEAQLGDDDD
jgi:UDP-3-O-[3-hydroxymyristoyl] glucosamine N-acyltransferase